jgi:RNA polymerase sigma factor (sigma-70 family)
MIEDVDLLRRYAERGSGEAFAELVRRRIALVYSVALRRTHDPHCAEDVTQAVFIALARKAAELSRRSVLIGWLYRSAQFAASDTMRAERRRQAREEEAHAMQQLAYNAPEPGWDKLRPVLDEVLNGIGARDRDAVLLRFVDGRPFAEIGAKLHLTENAARMCVERALKKLRVRLARRGLKSTAAALALILESQMSVAAPPGLAATVTGAVMAGAPSASGLAAGLSFLNFMSTSKITAIFASAVALVAIGFGIHENKRLRETESALVAAIKERDDLPDRLRSSEQRVAQQALQNGPGAIAPNQVQPMSSRSDAPQSRAAERNLVGEMTPVKDFKNAGNKTPSATVETLNWARENGDTVAMGKLISFSADGGSKAAAIFAGLSPDERAEYSISTPEEMIAYFFSGMGSNFAAVQQLGLTQSGDDDATIPVLIQKENGGVSNYQFDLQRTADGWKWVVPDNTIASVGSLLSKNASNNSVQRP